MPRIVIFLAATLLWIPTILIARWIWALLPYLARPSVLFAIAGIAVLMVIARRVIRTARFRAPGTPLRT